MKQYDCVIVGNGVLAYSTAFALLQRSSNLKIAIIGPRERTGSASVAAGAMLNCFAEVTNRTLATAMNRTKFEMALRSLNMWPKWLALINDALPNKQHIDQKQGTFVILNAESGQLDSENYSCIKNTLHQYDETFEEVSSKAIPGINPLEKSRPLQALYLPREGYINSLALLEALHGALESYSSVDIVDDCVKEITIHQGKISSVKTQQGEEYSADHVVIAAGSYSQQLLDTIKEIKDATPRMFAGVGYSALLQPQNQTQIKHVIRTPNRAGACGLHILPLEDNLLYVGATNNVCFSPSTHLTAGLFQFLIQCAIEQIDQDFYKASILGWHVGNRPVTIDTFPLIGETSIKGLWMLTGTYRDGLHQSPLLAQNIAAEILGEEPLFENLFKPERTLIQTMTVEESINEYLTHYLAGAYEHSIRLPKFMPELEFISLIRTKIERVYEQLDTTFGLSPEILLMLEFDAEPEKRITYLKEYLARCTKPLLSLVA